MCRLHIIKSLVYFAFSCFFGIMCHRKILVLYVTSAIEWLNLMKNCKTQSQKRIAKICSCRYQLRSKNCLSVPSEQKKQRSKQSVLFSFFLWRLRDRKQTIAYVNFKLYLIKRMTKKLWVECLETNKKNCVWSVSTSKPEPCSQTIKLHFISVTAKY